MQGSHLKLKDGKSEYEGVASRCYDGVAAVETVWVVRGGVVGGAEGSTQS